MHNAGVQVEAKRRRQILHRASLTHVLIFCKILSESFAEVLAKLYNTWAASVRSAVERAFATMKRWYGMGRVRYLGLARNACHLQFVAMAMNMNGRSC
jgi:hypothetical protein